MYIVALIIATIVPLLAFYGIKKLDLYATGSFRLTLMSFAWGLVTFGIAYLVNSALLDAGLITADFLRRYEAPILEELLKGLLLLFLVRRSDFNYFVDGAIYGFAIGIGFAIVENYTYVLAHQQTAIQIAVVRVLSTNLMHATGSALIGISLGYARFERIGRGLAAGLSGLALALLIHIGFNNLVTRVSSGLLLLYAIAVGLGGAAFIAFMIKRGLAEERAWIQEKLGAADRVTAGEAAVVNELADVRKLLKPIEDQFGQEKAQQVQEFLKLQAQLGIKRKMLDKLDDEAMQASIRVQMDEIREKMDRARQEVGAYTMLYVRNIFPSEQSPLWGQLDFAIEKQRAARSQNADQKGPDVWASLGTRMSGSDASNETELKQNPEGD